MDTAGAAGGKGDDGRSGESERAGDVDDFLDDPGHGAFDGIDGSIAPNIEGSVDPGARAGVPFAAEILRVVVALEGVDGSRVDALWAIDIAAAGADLDRKRLWAEGSGKEAANLDDIAGVGLDEAVGVGGAQDDVLGGQVGESEGGAVDDQKDLVRLVVEADGTLPDQVQVEEIRGVHILDAADLRIAQRRRKSAADAVGACRADAVGVRGTPGLAVGPALSA